MSVKVLGLPRAGTNYLTWLLRHNFDLELHEPGWVHGFPDEDWRDGEGRAKLVHPVRIELQGVTPILIRKDRKNWLASIRRSKRARIQIKERWGRVEDYGALYDSHCSAWAGLCHSVRYESFLSDFITTLDYLGTLVGSPPQRHKEPERIPESPYWKPEHRGRYV